MFFINLVFVEAKTSRKLNQKYRGQDKVAPVLSFYYGGAEEKNGQAKLSDCVGEIIICLSEAKKQNLSLEKLVIHGLRNLLSQIPTPALTRPGQDRDS